MKRIDLYKVLGVIAIWFLSISSTWAQEVEMADAMRSDGKIYVVIAVFLALILGLFMYLFILEKRLQKLERNQRD